MPQLPNRDEIEAQFARQLRRELRRQETELLSAIGDPPDFNNLSDGLWAALLVGMQQAVRPVLFGTYLDAAENLLNTLPVGVDWGTVNVGAARWARDYTYDLVSGINSTTRSALQERISAFFGPGAGEPQLTVGELRDALSRLFGPVRAASIATTEVTRASINGELAIVAELQRAGVQLTAIWETMADERVCQICGPRHERPRGDGWYDDPPAHPNCRCGFRYEVVLQEA